MAIKTKHLTIYFLPLIVLITTYNVFHQLTQYFKPKTAYFFGFVFYWLFCCITIPLLLLGSKSIKTLFKVGQPVFGRHKLRNILFLILPLAFAYSYEFPKVIVHSSSLIIMSSAGLSVINAVAEEILWRGTFLKLMGENSRWYIPFSSIGFALWHLAPLSIYGNRNPGGSLSFVLVSFLLGLLYSAVSKDTKSILFVTLSHILFDFSGLGARIYF